MTRYNVMPTDHSEAYDWKVEANGRKTSSHRTQQNAVKSARNRASPGDEIKVHGSSGRIRDSWTVRA